MKRKESKYQSRSMPAVNAPAQRCEEAAKDSVNPLNQAIVAYRTTLEALTADSVADAQMKVIQMLFERDVLAELITKQLPDNPDVIHELTELDQRLKSYAVYLTTIIDDKTWTNLRETRQPPPSSWWWWLNERAIYKTAPIWMIISILSLAASAALTAEIARRFLSSGGTDPTSISVPLLQAVLTAVSGGAFTQVGQEWIEQRLSKRNIPRRQYPIYKTSIPLFVMFIGIGIYLLLPWFAQRYGQRYFNQKAYEIQETGKLNEAIKNYERAINLAPDSAPVHYNLGDAYEISGDYDKAIVEYQTSLRIDMRSRFAPYAYNNLARLMLSRRNDPSIAIKLIDAALEQTPEDPLVRYSLLKNRAWAHLNLKCFGLAAADLCEAINLREKGAAAYCLLAQVLEAQGTEVPAEQLKLCKSITSGAVEAWESCEAFKSGQEQEIEASWLSLAQERLRKESVK
jgi:tetratricopeptide (TPR) repeat protein